MSAGAFASSTCAPVRSCRCTLTFSTLPSEFERLHERGVIFHRHAQRNVRHFASFWIVDERSNCEYGRSCFSARSRKFLRLFVHRRGANPQTGLLQRLFLFFARDRDVELHFVALGLRIFRHAIAALRDAFGLHLEILDAAKPFTRAITPRFLPARSTCSRSRRRVRNYRDSSCALVICTLGEASALMSL